jgi:hypothetical protein
MVLIPQIIEILDSFSPIGLEEMKTVRLMNRVDTKYVMSLGRLPDILTRMNGGYKVLEVNKNKSFSYDTIYLDTGDHMFFNQHVTGKLERNKVRYRKYESTGTTYLEVKKRTNKNRTIKWRIKNNFADNNTCDDRALEFIKEYVPLDSLTLKPVLINKFKRVTLVGSVINERITIDYDLSYSDTNGNQRSIPFIAIIELKREAFSDRSPVAGILKDCLIQPVGFSKYCIGSAILYDLPRKNVLKPKLLLINKIRNEFNQHFIT